VILGIIGLEELFGDKGDRCVRILQIGVVGS
jgi:hypothetical protein